jgi:hypothetical protein
MEDTPIDGLGGIHDFGVQHNGVHCSVMCPALIKMIHPGPFYRKRRQGPTPEGASRPCSPAAGGKISISSLSLLLPLLNFNFNTLLEFDSIQPPADSFDSSAGQISPKQAGIYRLNMAT